MQPMGNTTKWGRLADNCQMGDKAVTIAPISKEQEQAELSRARQLYKEKDYAQAFPLFKYLAEQCNNSKAWHNMGDMYQHGWGVPQDYAEAMRCYQEAADRGNTLALTNMGNMHCYGRGVPQDYAEAMRCYQEAADRGGVMAWNNMGYLYRHGLGVSVDDREADFCFRMRNSGAAPNLIERIKANQAALEKLKTDQGFKNILVLLRKYVGDKMLCDFITRDVSLESGSNKAPWIVALLKNSSCLQVEKGWLGSSESHYLCLPYVKVLSEILQFGWLEGDVSYGKLRILLNKIIARDEKPNFHQADLRGADLTGALLAAADLEGADLREAKSSDPDIKSMIEKQARYMLLLEGRADSVSYFNGESFPPELTKKIASLL